VSTEQDRLALDSWLPERLRGDDRAVERSEAAWQALLQARQALQDAGDLLLVMGYRRESAGGVEPRKLLAEMAGTVVRLAGLLEKAGVKGDGR
jgi:hypothetical protein